MSFIKETGAYKGIGQRLIGFCGYVSVVVRQCYRPRLILIRRGQNVKATITSFEIARWTRTVLCRPVIRSKTAGKLAGPPGP